MEKCSFKIFLCLFLSFLFSSGKNLYAQPFNLNESVQPVELNFTEYIKNGEDKQKGRISINKLTQENDTSYYFIKGLSMYSPTYFSLNTSDPEADIKVNLCKENWHLFHQTGQINGSSIWKTNFKTEGDFGIMVIARKKPVRYVLLVWSGDELNVEMPSVFKASDPAVAGGGSSWLKDNWVIIPGAILAVAIIAFLLIKLKKAKR